MLKPKINLLDLSYSELKNFICNELNQPVFRANQLWQWIWQKLENNFDKMSNISKNLREILKEKTEILWPEIINMQQSKDGTTKFLVGLKEGHTIETVLIPSENREGKIRWAQCVSTQVGCPMGCSFCATGKMGFTRNLTAGEILGQIIIGRNYLDDKKLDKPVLRNIVFMGMGEPLLNTKALLAALETLNNKLGMNFSPRRITVSTSGISEGLKTLGESGLAYLAISLHAPTQDLREKIMPAAAKWNLEELMRELKTYPIKTRERITFEYLLLGGINDSIEHAKQLTRLASHIKAKINLINYNPVPDLPFQQSTHEDAQKFQDYLCNHNITAIMRKSKGCDIAAACGQLKSACQAI